MTAEEYAQLPDLGQPSELVRGKVVLMNLPYPRHGEICASVIATLRNFVKKNRLGRVIGNDSGVITERDPDSVRGPDAAYYSYQRVPPGTLPLHYLDEAPEIAFEVLSPSDRWSEVLAKVAEYLLAGVQQVCVLDPATETAQVFCQDKPSRTLTAHEELAFPDVLAGFSVRVAELFE
jgi:Uma2 family endonuclease